MEKQYKIGYTTGVFDLFHIGHLNILKKAKDYCELLIVGVTIDPLVTYKLKKAVIPFEERIEIIEAIKYVDIVVPQENHNKIEAWKKYKFNVMFVGDDWKNTKEWDEYEFEFNKHGVDIVYFPYTKTTSSTLINETLLNLRKPIILSRKEG